MPILRLPTKLKTNENNSKVGRNSAVEKRCVIVQHIGLKC